MPTFNCELVCRLLIGLLLGFLLHYKTYKNQFYIINQKIDQIINKIEPRKSQLKNKINILMIKNIHKRLKIYGRISNNYLTKRLNWIQNFHLVKWTLKFVNYLEKEKGVTTSTITVAGHCRSSVIHYKHYTKNFIVTHFKNKNLPIFM